MVACSVINPPGSAMAAPSRALWCDSSHVHATPLCAAASHPARIPRDTFRRGVQCGLPPGCRAWKHSGCLGRAPLVCGSAVPHAAIPSLLASVAFSALSRGWYVFWPRSRCMDAATLFSETRALCTAASPERGCGGAGDCRIKHDRGICRARELFALPRLVFVLPYGVCTRSRCVGAAALLSGVRAVCTAAIGFTGVTALAIAELSTTETFAARMSCLLCRGLFSCSYGVCTR